MHMQGLPKTMQLNPQYQDVVEEVARYLKARAAECVQAGIDPERITLDPGFGFGKNLQHNITLIQHLPELMEATGFPLLIGVSRKRMIGELTGEQDAAKRVHGSFQKKKSQPLWPQWLEARKSSVFTMSKQHRTL